MVYFFLNDYQKLETLVNETNLCKSTKIKFRNLFRNAILGFLIQNPQRICGHNRDFQVDETLIFRRKNHVGRLVKQVWLVEGICTTPLYDFF